MVTGADPAHKTLVFPDRAAVKADIPEEAATASQSEYNTYIAKTSKVL